MLSIIHCIQYDRISFYLTACLTGDGLSKKSLDNFIHCWEVRLYSGYL